MFARWVTDGPLYDFFNNWMLLSNGPLHRRRRAPFARVFALELITQMRPRIRAIADELIDRLGLPAADIPEFTDHVYNLARSLSSAFSRDTTRGAGAIQVSCFCSAATSGKRHARIRR